MTEVLEEIRALARQFARDQLRPNVERWDHDRALDSGTLGELGELGFSGMTVPEAYGGMELDLPTYAASIEELAWGDAAVALVVARGATTADLLLRHGSDAQKQAWLERLASGDAAACTATAEHGTTADGIRATAVGDGWRLNGTTGFVVNGGAAELVLVRAGPDADADTRAHRDGGTSPSPLLFLVRSDAPGYRVVERESTLGFRAVEIVRIALDDVRLGEDAVLRVDSAGTDLGRISVAAIGLGIAQAALDHARDYADQREQFGQKLRTFEGVQLKLADMAIRVRAARALVAEAASSATPTRTAAAKIIASEAAMWVSTQAVQVFGGYGYMRDYPVEKLMRDAKGTELLEGANDDLRVLIAAEMYG